MSNAREIVEQYKEAMGRADFAAARKLLHDDLFFQGPLDTFHQADDYIAASQRLANIIQRIDVKKIFADGNDVCVLYDMVTNTPTGTAFIVEWYQVRGDKIGELRAVFDARPFAPMFGR
jgi:limonene-1,2-epoxide hydrolase